MLTNKWCASFIKYTTRTATFERKEVNEKRYTNAIECDGIYLQNARARIAWASEVGDRRYLGEVVASFQENYDERWRVWVYRCGIMISDPFPT